MFAASVPVAIDQAGADELARMDDPLCGDQSPRDVGRGFDVSRTIRWLVVVAAVLAMSGMAGAAWVHLSRPAVLKVAVGPAGFADAELMGAFSRILSANKSSVQLKVEHTAGPSDAVGKLMSRALSQRAS